MIPCKDLVESPNYLGIQMAFLGGYSETISDRIQKAAAALNGAQQTNKPNLLSQESLFAINQCVHLASSIVLLGTEAENLTRTTEHLSRHAATKHGNSAALRGVDPTTVVTMATLHYLLCDWPEKAESKLRRDDESLRLIRLRLDDVNWLIGRGWMTELVIAAES